MVNGRSKGRAFEQAIARDLREMLGDEYAVKRLRTDEQQGVDHAGEFAITGPVRFPFAVECKTHKAFSVVQLWKSPTVGPLPGWWGQSVSQAICCGRLPLLAVRVPHGPVLCVMRLATARAMWLTGHKPTMRVWLDDGTPGGDWLWVGLWEHFISTARWQEVT